MAKDTIIIDEKGMFRALVEDIPLRTISKKGLSAAGVLAAGAALASVAVVTFNAGSSAPNTVPMIDLDPNYRNFALANNCDNVVLGSNNPAFVNSGNKENLNGTDARDCTLGGLGNEVFFSSLEADRYWGKDTLDASGNFVTGPNSHYDILSYRFAPSGAAGEGVSIDLLDPKNNRGSHAEGDQYTGINAYELSEHADKVFVTDAGSIVNGRGGVDTAFFKQERRHYTITVSGPNTTVSSPSGVTSLSNFEKLQFADQTVPVVNGALGSSVDTDQMFTDGNDEPAQIQAGKRRIFLGLGKDTAVPSTAGCPDGVVQVFGDSSKNLATGAITYREGNFNSMDYKTQPDPMVFHQTDPSKILGSYAKCYELNSIQRIFGTESRPPQGEETKPRNVFYAGPKSMTYVGGDFHDAVYFKGNYADYTIEPADNGYTTVVTPKTGTNTGEGVTRLQKIDKFIFNDGSVFKQEPFRPNYVDIKLEIAKFPPNMKAVVVYYGPSLAGKMGTANEMKRTINKVLAGEISPGFGPTGNGVGEAGSMFGQGTYFSVIRRDQLDEPIKRFRLVRYDTPASEPITAKFDAPVGVVIMGIVPVGSDSQPVPVHLRTNVPEQQRFLAQVLYDAYIAPIRSLYDHEAFKDKGHEAACYVRDTNPEKLNAYLAQAQYTVMPAEVQAFVLASLGDWVCDRYKVVNQAFTLNPTLP